MARRYVLTLSLILPVVLGGPRASCGEAEAATDALLTAFRSPPPEARPGVYWYFMDGNRTRRGMTDDLESMVEAGLGNLVFLEVDVGVPRGPVAFLSDRWQDLFVHAVREAERLGIEITLGSGPGWAGSGGPWVKLEDSMQHLVASAVAVKGPSSYDGVLPRPEPRTPFFGYGSLTDEMRRRRDAFYRDVRCWPFPRRPGTSASMPSTRRPCTSAPPTPRSRASSRSCPPPPTIPPCLQGR